MEQARLLVFSDDREFVNALAQSWKRLGSSREFTVSGTKSAGRQVIDAVVLTDDVAALPRPGAGVVLAIAVTADPAPPELSWPEANAGTRVMTRVVWIERSAGWADVAAALAQETLLRLESQAELADARHRLREAERFAALGRFIVEARHGLGNALTGVLGHTELLLLEAGQELPGQTRAQVETIHAMSLKIHETFHRLSSLDIELKLAEQQAEREMQCRPAQ